MSSLIATVSDKDILAHTIYGLQQQNYAATRAWGVVITDGKKPNIKTAPGLAYFALNPKNIDPNIYRGNAGIAHSACSIAYQPQPIQIDENAFIVIDATPELTLEILDICSVTKNPERIATRALRQIKTKPFALIILDGSRKIVATRNSCRRPLSLSQFKDDQEGRFVSSQSGALGIFGVFEDSIFPGEVLIVKRKWTHCFECTYRTVISRGKVDEVRCSAYVLSDQHPSGYAGKRSVHEIRLNLGKRLGIEFTKHLSSEKIKEWQTAGVVIPIPHGGTLIAQGISEGIKIPVSLAGASKPRYPISDQVMLPKDREIHLYYPIESVIRGKHVLIADEGIIGGKRIRDMADQARKMGALSVHGAVVVLTSKICPCGKDNVGNRDYIKADFIYNKCGTNPRAISTELHLDSFTYLRSETMVEAIGNPNRTYCRECLA